MDSRLVVAHVGQMALNYIDLLQVIYIFTKLGVRVLGGGGTFTALSSG